MYLQIQINSNGAFILGQKRKRRRFRSVALFPICVFILQRQRLWMCNEAELVTNVWMFVPWWKTTEKRPHHWAFVETKIKIDSGCNSMNQNQAGMIYHCIFNQLLIAYEVNCFGADALQLVRRNWCLHPQVHQVHSSINITRNNISYVFSHSLKLEGIPA